ncbi:transmembrane protein [Vreelandella venusta]|nr:transmembrane protein [Halomonas hydrothermalis]
MKILRAEPLPRYHHHDMHLGFIDRILVKDERERPDFNRRMFDEDFTRLFHSINRRSGNLFEIVSNDDELIQKLLGNFETRYAPHPVDESIRELVEEVAQSLIWFGRAYFFLHDDTEQEKIHVASFSSYGVVRLFGTHIQWVPKRWERHWDRDDEQLPREIRILDAAKVMRFDMPTPLKRVLSAQNRTLAVLDKHQFGEANFHSQATHENPNPTNHFDFRVWRDVQERALYRATRRTGWNGRKYDSTKRSDFFDCHRLIRFRRNQLLLRDDILKQLSGELSRVGKDYNTEFSVEITGTDELPNVAHLNELEVRLAREEVGFNEIIDYCYKR